ncbi:Na+/H+ antiporter NhaC [Clostridiales bacterium TF09-2AC]|uniref:Na+/H+ antiporter NhaC n=1 Tax=Enterocloster hominis (ex Hitch et al. 2024) TaxID=1917870 RepID=A0ABV1DCT1_9FIRM|nr:Na+/H+ antiporter NhaC [Clostridiales bacterium TF09-2AC]
MKGWGDVKLPDIKISLLGVLGILCILFTGTLLLKTDIIVLLILSIIFIAAVGTCSGMTMEDSLDGMREGCSQAFIGLLFFLLIGAIIGVWIQAGTVPALVYYGLGILTPRYFLLSSFLICSLVSLVLGTSWGTVGTVGVAIMGVSMGSGISVPVAVTAGAIVAGSWFGDKMSPISDSTVLTAASSGTDVYRHIRSMAKTTLPSYGVSLVLFFLLNRKYARNAVLDTAQIGQIRDILQQEFVINIWVFLPAILLVILCIARIHAVLSLILVIGAGCVCSVAVQGNTVSGALRAIMDGGYVETISEEVNLLVNRGGINSMLPTFLLGFMALCLGGILQKSRFLHVILKRVTGRLKNHFSLIAVTMLTSILGNAVFGDTYLTIVLNGNIYKEAYDERGLDRAVLSRTIEEGATMSTPLIPWTAASAFIYGALGVSALEYGRFALLNLVNPVVSMLMAAAGIGLALKKGR